METPRVHLMRQLLVLAVLVAAAAYVLWPRWTPDCSHAAGGGGGVHVSLPTSIHHLGLVLTCAQ